MDNFQLDNSDPERVLSRRDSLHELPAPNDVCIDVGGNFDQFVVISAWVISHIRSLASYSAMPGLQRIAALNKS